MKRIQGRRFYSLSYKHSKSAAQQRTRVASLAVPMSEPIVSKSGNSWSGHGAMSLCQRCGAEIWHKPSHVRKYCTKDCRRAAEYELSRQINSRPCVACGTLTYRPPAHWRRLTNQDKFYCSHKCHGAANGGAENPAYTGSRDKVCPYCKEQFQAIKGKQTYCSSICSGAAYHQRTLKKWGGAVRHCLYCSMQFEPVTKIQKYCNRKCADKHHAHRISGNGNGRYVHGDALRPYPPGWTRTHKEQIRERDGHSCRLCGRAAEPQRRLDVHHIDYNKDNLDPSNLITLCRFCHGKMHGLPASREEWKKKLSLLLSGCQPSHTFTT